MNKKEIRILYMGTPEISARLFENLITNGYNIIGLITSVDKAMGRNKKVSYSPTKIVAEKYNIPVYQKEKIRLDYDFVYDLKPDLILTFAYGQIVPTKMLDIPSFGSLNLHGSILPKYRGASPIQTSLLYGDKITGVSLMKMVKEMDAGEVYKIEQIDILDDDNYTSLSLKMSDAAFKLIDENLDNYLNGELKGVKQDENNVSFCFKISPNDEFLNKDMNVEQFYNRVKALSDVPGGYIFIDNKKIKIYKCKIIERKINEDYGKFFINKGRIFLSLKDGLIELNKLQLEGKKILDEKDFANGANKFNNRYIG